MALAKLSRQMRKLPVLPQLQHRLQRRLRQLDVGDMFLAFRLVALLVILVSPPLRVVWTAFHHGCSNSFKLI